MLEGELMVKVTVQAEPVEGILPVPDQPTQTYWIPDPPPMEGVTESVIELPALNHPLPGLGES